MTVTSTSPAASQGSNDWTEPCEAQDGDGFKPVPASSEGRRIATQSSRRIRGSQVSLDTLDRVLQLLDRTSLPAPRTSAIFVRMLSRYAEQILDQILHLSCHAPAGEAEHSEHERDHDEHGWDAADPTLSAVTGGVKTNVRRMASAKGTKRACAQYRTTTTSTQPANVTHGLKILAESSIVVRFEERRHALKASRSLPQRGAYWSWCASRRAREATARSRYRGPSRARANHGLPRSRSR